MRQMIDFRCGNDTLAGTLDHGASDTGLLIVSGGNEIRSGAFAGQSAMAAHFAENGHAVFRYDRRGTGDSEGQNSGFENSLDDIIAAIATFRKHAPYVDRIIAFGNCDAAAALGLFHKFIAVDALVLANPWIIDTGPALKDEPVKPTAAAIRSRYWARLKNPRSLLDLLTGKINLRKLAGGLLSATRKEKASGLALRLAEALGQTTIPVTLLIARRDTTAMAFMGAWNTEAFAGPRSRTNIKMEQFDTASHGFADAESRLWLFSQIGKTFNRI